MRKAFPGAPLIFRVITLSEPPKNQLVPYLQAEKLGTPLPRVSRLAQVHFYLENATQYRSARVDLATGNLFDLKTLDGKHAYVDAGEMKKAEKACLADVRVQAAIKALQLPKGAVVVCDPWTYSPDGMNDMSRRCIVVRIAPSWMIRSRS